jgi:hypothetical protein
MPRKLRTEEGYVVVCSLQETASALDVADMEIEHWIAHRLIENVYQDQRETPYIDAEEVRLLRRYIQSCPDYWSHEQMMWYRFFTRHTELASELEQQELRQTKLYKNVYPSWIANSQSSQQADRGVEPVRHKTQSSNPQQRGHRSMERRTLGCFESER